MAGEYLRKAETPHPALPPQGGGFGRGEAYELLPLELLETAAAQDLFGYLGGAGVSDVAAAQDTHVERIAGIDHNSAGTVQFPGFPYKLSQTPATVRLPPPTLGQHTEEILVELLSYSPVQVAALRESGAV